MPRSLNTPNGRDVALLVMVSESRSASVAVTVKLRMSPSATVWFPIGVRIGAWLTLVTLSKKVSSSFSEGIPSSVAVTITV